MLNVLCACRDFYCTVIRCFFCQKLSIAPLYHNLNLVSLPHFYPFQQLCQNRALSRHRRQIELVGPAEELIVVFADFLNRIAPRIIFQQRGVFVFCLLYLSLGLPNQASKRGLREGTLPVQAADDLFLVPLLFVLGRFDLLLRGLLFAVQFGVLLADTLLNALVVRFSLDFLRSSHSNQA